MNFQKIVRNPIQYPYQPHYSRIYSNVSLILDDFFLCEFSYVLWFDEHLLCLYVRCDVATCQCFDDWVLGLRCGLTFDFMIWRMNWCRIVLNCSGMIGWRRMSLKLRFGRFVRNFSEESVRSNRISFPPYLKIILVHLNIKNIILSTSSIDRKCPENICLMTSSVP